MKCAVCKYKFQPARADAKTCSSRCRQKAYRKRLSVTKTVTGNVHFSSRTYEWPTPQDVFDKLDRDFGFELDVCATAENAKCARFYTKAEDGLAQLWEGTVWMNPPYGRHIAPWIAKAWDAALAGATVVALIPARTDTKWWHGIVTAASEVRYLPGRLRFGGCKHSAPFPSAVAIWRPSR